MKRKIVLPLVITLVILGGVITYFFYYHNTSYHCLFPKSFQGYTLQEDYNESGYGPLLNYTVYYYYYYAFYSGKDSNISVLIYNITSESVANSLYIHLSSIINSTNRNLTKYVKCANSEENFFFNHGYVIVVQKGNIVIEVSSVNGSFSTGVDIIKNVFNFMCKKE
jgi:hypothetical protein